MDTIRVEFSAAALYQRGDLQKIDAVRPLCKELGWTLGIQIHNTTPLEQIERLHRTGLPLSYHAPVCADYQINLAARDESYAQQALRESAAIMHRFGGEVGVFHGFHMTDDPLLAFNSKRSYRDSLSPSAREELLRPGHNLSRDFFQTDEFRRRLIRLSQRLQSLPLTYPDITWCIENDYPCYTSALILAEHAAQLRAPLCLDTSHLWIASLLFERDVLEQTRILAETGYVRCAHVHACPIKADTPLEEYRDGHRSLTINHAMPLKEMCLILHDAGMRHWILETFEADRRDFELLAEWLG